MRRTTSMSRTIQQALTVGAAALLLVGPVSARAQRASVVSPTKPIEHPAFRVQQTTAVEQMTRLRSLPNGAALLSATNARGLTTINGQSSGTSGSGSPPISLRSGHTAHSPTSGSSGSGGTVHGSQPVGSTSSGTNNN